MYQFPTIFNSSRYLASTLRPSHQLQSVIISSFGPRDMKGTLMSVYSEDISPYLVNRVVPEPNYNNVKNRLHANFVHRAIDARQNRNILRCAASPVNTSDKRLPRAHLSTLAQLQSGYCSALNDNLVRVGRADSSACPECGADEHSPSHLFSCSTHPTDLWLRPSHVANLFLLFALLN